MNPSTIELIMWGVFVVSIVSTVANLYKVRWCFVGWMFGNVAWFAYDIYKTAYPQAAQMVVYFCLAAWGYWKWGREKNQEPEARSKEQGDMDTPLKLAAYILSGRMLCARPDDMNNPERGCFAVGLYCVRCWYECLKNVNMDKGYLPQGHWMDEEIKIQQEKASSKEPEA